MNGSTTYQANLYPAPAPLNGASAPTLGVCFSGGGSRALSCALGQLSGLRSLLAPGTSSKTVLDCVQYISSVSGGSWASVLYTYLPQKINGQKVTDDDFLIACVDPGQLVKQDPSVTTPQNVCYLPPFCLGNAPGHFNATEISQLLYAMYEWGMFGVAAGASEKRSWWWIAAVGELILKPFGLYSAVYDQSVNFIQPDSSFSLSADYVTQNITNNNPSLTPSQFYPCRTGRPGLFVNTNLMQNYLLADTAQIPVQGTPTATSILGESPDQTIVGGGGVESFSFTSTLVGQGANANLAAVTMQRNYSLCDIAGCSSAFFADLLLEYINNVIQTELMTELAAYLTKEGFTPLEVSLIVGGVTIAAEALLDTESSETIPQYNYWPLGEVGQSSPANTSYGFSDGGDFEDIGILGLLAQTDVNRIIAFVNSEEPISVYVPPPPNPPQVLVSGQVPLLFGYQDTAVNGTYPSFGGMSPGQPMSYVQVFSDANHEFAALLQGLYNASCGSAGGALGTGVAAFVQTLTTVDNPVAHIKGGREVTVLWVYNNRVNAWQNAISDPGIQSDLASGQPTNPQGPLANFPNYSTGLQLGLGAESVNMLAQLSAWNVRQLAGEIAQMLT